MREEQYFRFYRDLKLTLKPKKILNKDSKEGGQNRPINEDIRKPLNIEENSNKGSENGIIAASEINH